jgi:hypothetical protein
VLKEGDQTAEYVTWEWSIPEASTVKVKDVASLLGSIILRRLVPEADEKVSKTSFKANPPGRELWTPET